MPFGATAQKPKQKTVSIVGKDGIRKTYTLEEAQAILAKYDLEEKARTELIKITGNDRLHRGIRIHPTYRVTHVHPDTEMQLVELACFARNWPTEYGGLGAFGHFKNFCAHTWDDLQWNDWLESQLRSLCDSEWEHKHGRTRVRFVNWVGAGSAGKTFSAGLFACAWFMADPERTSVTLTSTSKGIIAQRVWPVIQKLWWGARRRGERWEWGHMLESHKQVQAKKGDAKHSICALAVESGDLQSSLDRIKGRHTPRMMLIVDEANSTPQAIFECIPNMLTAVEELIVLVIGNAGSRLDPHGYCCEPEVGWKGITIDDTIWKTKGVPKWGIESGVCLHFDGAKSPNVLAGKTLHPHIYTYERWQAVIRHGEEYRNTLQHWSQDRGFWPADGFENTVFTEQMVLRNRGMETVHFRTVSYPIAFLDPGFGGDRCVATFADVGDSVDGGAMTVQINERVFLDPDPKKEQEADFQIAYGFKDACIKRGVNPERAGIYATGTGRGVYAITSEHWSGRVHRIEEGGAASERIASADDPRPAKEVYQNRVSELWFSARELLLAGQLKGLYHDAVIQFCSRRYEYKSKRIMVEPKPDLKLRLGRSPDDADCVAGLVEIARLNGLVLASGIHKRQADSWRELSKSVIDINEQPYSEEPSFAMHSEETFGHAFDGLSIYEAN